MTPLPSGARWRGPWFLSRATGGVWQRCYHIGDICAGWRFVHLHRPEYFR